MAKKLCNACVLQNWMFDSWEEAEAWLMKERGVVSVPVFRSVPGGKFVVTVTRSYNSVPVTMASQIAIIGALISGFDIDRLLVPEV